VLSPEECLVNYENYLKSSKRISYAFHLKSSPKEYSGKVKYNGNYLHSRITIKEDSEVEGYTREVLSSEEGFQELYIEDASTSLTVNSYLDFSKAIGFTIESFFPVQELLGRIGIHPPLETNFLPDLLRSMNLVVSKGEKSGFDLFLLSGNKENISINAWFDPDQGFALRFLDISQKNASKTGETIMKSVVLGQFIDVKGVGVPTLYEQSLQQVNVNNMGVHESQIAYVIYDIDILDSRVSGPFKFETIVPNGTKSVLYDSPNIQYVWCDGKIVPRTDEVMLAIARGNHKFMPGPQEPRFWMITIGILLIVYACSAKAYQYFKNKGQ